MADHGLVRHRPTRSLETMKTAIFCGLLSLGISGAFLVPVWYSNREYFSSTERNVMPDAVDYGRLAENMLHHGAFSRTTDLFPDPFRTPGYPILLCMLRSDISPIPTYIAQILMLAGFVFLVVSLT